MIADVRRALALLTPARRAQWMALVPVAVLCAILEAAGLAAVYALVNFVANAARPAPLSIVWSIAARISSGTSSSAVWVLTLLVAAVYIVRNVVVTLAAWLQERVMAGSAADVSSALLREYLDAPYDAHIGAGSAALIHRLTESVDVALRFVLASAVNIGSELLVIAGIVVVLAIASPPRMLATLVIAVALLFVPLAATRRVFERWGAERHALETELLAAVQQSAGALREARVAGRERFFHDAFARRQAAVMRLRSAAAAASTALRVGAESVFVLGLLLTVLLTASLDRGGGAAMPLLGMFAYAGFRIIPSVNRIMLNASNMALGKASLDAVSGQAASLRSSRPSALRPGDERPMTFRQSIVFDRVSYRYEGRARPAIDAASFEIRRGEAVGIAGATGAGKSTLVDLLLGLLSPDSGRVLVDGADVQSNVRGWQRHLGYVAQAPFLLDDSLLRNIVFGAADEEVDAARVERTVTLARLDAVVGGLPRGLSTAIGEHGARLSGGERQRVAVARALYRDADVLVLDEAVSALDSRTSLEITRALQPLKGSRTLVIVAHRLSTLRACDRLIFLETGRVSGAGRLADLVETSAAFRAFIDDELAPGAAITPGTRAPSI